MSQQQNALFLQSKHGEFVVGSRSIPKPGRGEVLIQVYSTALNPVDYKVQEYGVFVDTYPAVLGVDIAGNVEEVGEGVHAFAKGDRVFTHGNFSNDQSGYQQFTLGVADFTAKIPNNLGYDDAATIPLGFDTALTGLYGGDLYGIGLTPPWAEGGLSKYKGNPIVIIGGSSSVGSYAIQLARLSGFSPIIATASSKHEAYLKSLGATHVFERRLSADDLKVAVSKVTSTPIKVVYDSISLAETQRIGWSLLAPKGAFIVTLPALVTEEEGKERRVIQTYGSPHAEQNKMLCSGSWAKLEKLLEDGSIKPNRYEVLPNGLEGIANGLKRMKEGLVSGTKLVAHPQETK